MNKITTYSIIILGLLAIGIGGFLGYHYIKQQDELIKIETQKLQEQKMKEETQKSLEEARGFTGGIVRFPKVIGILFSKWIDGKINYRFEFNGIDEKFYNAINNYENNDASLKVELVDTDGFTIKSIKINLSDMVHIWDDNDKLTSLHYSGYLEMSSSDYLKIDSISVISNIQ